MSATKKSAVIEVEVIESSELVITKATPGLAIEGNFEAVKAHIERLVADYTGLVITESYVPQAKKDRAYLNSISTTLTQLYRETKRKYMAPVDVLDRQIKEIEAPAKAASLAIDEQVKAFEAAERVSKRIELVKHYADYAGALVEVVPFERIEDPAWLNKSVNLMAAFESIEKTIDRIARDDATLEGMELAYLTDAKTTYFETLDLGASIARSKALEEAAERTRRLDAEKAEIAAYRSELEAKVAEAVPELLTYDESRAMLDEVARAKAEEITAGIAELVAECSTFTFTVVCTDAQSAAIRDILRGMGLTGTVRKEA
jgi:hypothetical protein